MNFLEYIHPETNPPRDSIALVIPVTGSQRNPKFLVARRIIGFRNWEYTFPGGAVEENERPKRAAAREAREEADLHFTEFDLIPAQRNPSIERWGGAFHKVYKYFAYVDRRRMKPRRMESKLGEWKTVSEREMIGMIRNFELPDWVLRGWWRDVLHDTRRDRLS